MRTSDVVKATAAGSWNLSNDTAAPIAMAAATMQETMKTHMFALLSEGNEIIMDPPAPISKRSNAA
jgi:hypothetical protein